MGPNFAGSQGSEPNVRPNWPNVWLAGANVKSPNVRQPNVRKPNVRPIRPNVRFELWGLDSCPGLRPNVRPNWPNVRLPNVRKPNVRPQT